MMPPASGRVDTVIEGGRLGKYVITGTLGKGAMGTVYDGRDPVIDRRVAIKTITLPDPDDAEAQEELARFRREAQAAGRLQHPNIVGIYDYGETETIAYIVMEFVDGTSLKSLLEKQERFPPAEAVRVLTGLLAGLQYSHEAGVVHRDIKPANVMITRLGVVKIADFGIARIESSSLTQAGTIMGTPAYMSPEQFMGQTVDARTDIYSAGVVLYQMLTGERPFEGSMTAIMHKALNTVPPRPSQLSVTAPEALDPVVARAMAKRPEDRFADAASFAQALQEGLTARPAAAAPVAASVDSEATVVSRRPTPPPAAPAAAPVRPPAGKKAPLGLLIGAAALVLVLLAGGGYALLGGLGSAPPPTKVTSGQTVMHPQDLPQAVKEPPPTQTPAPPARQAEAPLPSPPDPVAALRTAMAAAVAATPCSLISGAVGNDGSITLHGVVPRDTVATLLGHTHALAPTASVDNHLALFTGPYCQLLDVLRPVAPQFGQRPAGLQLDLKNGARRLVADEYIIPKVHVLDDPAVLQIDYFSSDGSLTHLHQPADDHGRLTPADGVLVVGDPAAGSKGWQVAEPFGTDLLVALASDRPLFDKPRPDTDTTATYLRDLRAAIEAAQRRGGRVNARAYVVETAAK